ncbi:hypothetical protein SAMN04490243_2559 [Robiginitalea myxolifaciens]|uniref:Glycosyl hydrolases family 43 n=1 Tax=Robiginitalea myxolifaciens TaxID=400055 RepID=A0A1I6HCB3_9FLAO|nr:hypothetical protein [Robiginitalea myxolifaciens]SFR52156.1 hypothetical protein SAMN04490243_2559 [Robiginitalea myxolifaciens]
MKKIVLTLGFVSCLLLCCSRSANDPMSEQSIFERTESPVYSSPIGLAGDPSILKSGDSLLLYYTAEEGIALAYSLDNGQNWMRPTNASSDFIALEKRPDAWDNVLETVEVIKVNEEFKMYYTGYREGEGDTPQAENYEIGLATSRDGLRFERVAESIEAPIIQRDVSNDNTLDRHAMTSPGVVYENGTYYMIYAGWNVADNWTGPNAGIRILGATSTDGIRWEKIAAPIISPSEVTYSPDINEATLMKSEDGWWYIVFSTDRSIGIARSNSFSGSYQIYPEAIVDPLFEWDSEVTAPDGIIENGKFRIWYHGVKEPEYWPWLIGYAEADYPLNWE